MAATPQNPAAAAPRRKVSRHRGEGQWAAGHHTPLNGNEQFKKDDDGLNVRTRIETIYSKRGFDSIDPNDLRGRMRWWGLYTQRKPGIDGGKTAILEPEELDDKYSGTAWARSVRMALYTVTASWTRARASGGRSGSSPDRWMWPRRASAMVKATSSGESSGCGYAHTAPCPR
jgi:hypothetical protein